MKIDTILDLEESNLLDYLHGYCDNPLATADDKLKALFTKWNYNPIHEADRIRDILDNNVKRSYFLCGVPEPIDYSIWLNIAEIEIPADEIEPDETEYFTIIGEYAYYYVGYGFMIEYNVNGIIAELKAYEGIKHE